MPVVVVTDSTASLPPDVADKRGLVIVPLQVVIGADVYDEGSGGATPELVAQALKEWKPVSTSRPTPAALLEVYETVARDGAEAIVSIHLSGDMSGTFESAQLAAREAPVPVVAVDSRQVGVATGYAVLAAADAVDAGATAEEAADAARARAAASSSLFYVDTLEYLRRGGRIGAARALLGSALAVKPLLRVENGQIALWEKVRTASRGVARLEEKAVADALAANGGVDIGVHHLAAADRAAALAQRLRNRVPGLRGLHVQEVGAVIGAHVGPGMLAVVIAPQLSPPG